MENKKTLWIIAAVGAFLLVVLGGALIMYSPSAAPSQTIAQLNPNERQNNGWANQNSPVPDTSVEHQLQFPNTQSSEEPLKANEVYLVADKANVYTNDGTTIDLNSLKTLNDEAKTQNINVTVSFADSADREKFAPAERPGAPRDFEKTPAVKEKAGNVTKSAKAAPVTVKKSEVKNTPAPSKTVKPAPQAPSKYWVQVAAYSNKKGAESARSALGTNQIQADIFTYRDAKENLFYRVRVGPYTTKSEAEYWRQKITKISDFSNAKSYVTSTN